LRGLLRFFVPELVVAISPPVYVSDPSPPPLLRSRR
jgi:hypothetical protein